MSAPLDQADTLAQPIDLGSAPTLAHPSSDEGASQPGHLSFTQNDTYGSGGSDPGERYLDQRLLGEGGMGEVRLVKDLRIGREVAQKTLRGNQAAQQHAVERFLREARVQAQLEHPAVVPVYDLGETNGRGFFTMKRVRGRSLESIIEGLRGGDAATLEAFPRRRLLNAFVQVCLAMEYAHARGVLHRDLKPANVMLGDFGEVHVLDWGLARVRGVADPVRGEIEGGSLEVGKQGVGQTADGSLMGTPGYMPPEQAKGQQELLDERADVYALGAILFELLFLEPLHGQPSAMARLVQTVQGPSPAIAERARYAEVPPELTSLIASATALDKEQRPRSARALSTAVERYLDGEQDAARRRELAQVHRLAAEDHQKKGELPLALRELGRALALVPTDDKSLVALEALLTHLPSEVPDEAKEELRAMRQAHGQASARTSTVRLLTWLLAVPLVIAFGVTDWVRGAMVIGALVSAAGIAFVAWRGQRTHEGWSLALGIASSLALMTFSFVLGPFIVVPGLASTNAMFFAMTTERTLRPAWLSLGVLAIALPFVLGLMGLDPHYQVVDDALVVRSTLSHLPLEGTLFFLFLTSLATVITPTVLAGRMRDRLAQAEEKVFLQAWHLKHLLPRNEPAPS